MRLLPFAALLAAAIALPAAAQTTLKPGLWELTNTTKSATGQLEQAQAQMRQQLAAMPPEQRKQIEEMMARQGVKMGGAGGATTMQVCMTKEMTDRSEMPMKSDCKVTSQSRSGGTMKMAFACPAPPSSGESEYTMMGSDAYKGRTVIKTTVDGKPETMTVEASGKWLGADCGNIRPLVPPKK